MLLGEFGTKLQTTSDKQWLAAMVSYLQRTGISFAYWDYNPNSGDTGGLVADDWRTPETAKLTALKPILGTQTTVPGTNPTPTPTPRRHRPEPRRLPRRRTVRSARAGSCNRHGSPGHRAYGYVANIVVSSTTTHTGWTRLLAGPGREKHRQFLGNDVPHRQRPDQLLRVPTGASCPAATAADRRACK